MLSRGNATSGAPICSGSRALAKPAKSGVAKSSSMIEPCIVNIALNCSRFSTTCRPGAKSSRRMMSASSPPKAKKAIAVTKYRLPITLWSVVVRTLTIRLPIGAFGCGRPSGTPAPGRDVVSVAIS